MDVPVNEETGSGRYDIIIGIIDDHDRLNDILLTEEATRLRGLPNRDQAYVIRSPEEGQTVLAALSEEGVYYAAQNFIQLLGRVNPEKGITIPMVTVTDWPDIAFRGAWDDTFPPEQIEWMSSYKMNRVDCHARLTVDRDGTPGITSVPAKGPRIC